MHQTMPELLGTARVWIIQTAQHACVHQENDGSMCARKRMAACAAPHTGNSWMHANCRMHQTTALLHNISILLTLATNSNHQLTNRSSNQPEFPQAFLLLGCHGELFEVEDDVSQVMHPEAVCRGAVALPSVLGSPLHAPVCVRLQHTHLVTHKGKKG